MSGEIAAKNQLQSQDYEFLDAQPLNGPTLCYWLWMKTLAGKTYVQGPLYIDLEAEDPFEDFEPDQNRLLGAFPNPFRLHTDILYDLAQPAKVEISIYNIKGQLIQKQSFEHASPGRYFWRFLGQDKKGRKLSSGTYLIRMKAPGFSATKKMMYFR